MNRIVNREYGKPTDPMFYFIIANSIVENLTVALYYILWTKQTHILSIYNKVQEKSFLAENQYSNGKDSGEIRQSKRTCNKVSTVNILL